MEKETPHKDVAPLFGVPKNTLPIWKKNKDKIFEKYNSSQISTSILSSERQSWGCFRNWISMYKKSMYLTKSKYWFLFEAIDGDAEHVHMLCFWCLFTPLSNKTPMTPTLLRKLFGAKKIFSAVDLKCWFFLN